MDMIERGLTRTRGVGWPKSDDFERTYFLNGLFVDFIIQNMAYLI